MNYTKIISIFATFNDWMLFHLIKYIEQIVFENILLIQ